MISEAELAQMKADWWERLRHKEKKIVALEREVEELTKENAGLREIGTRLLVIRDEKMKTIEELRAALREVLVDWDQGAFLTRVALAKARAALGDDHA